jgi:putative transposase
MAVFEKFHFEHPYYGSRRLAVQFGMSRDKVQRLMRDLHLVATYPKPKTTTPNSEHKKFHYLLRNILPVYPNPIWSTNITYIAMSHGFMYLMVIIDWYSRMILKLFDGRATKNSMDGRGRWVDNVMMERFWWSLKYEDAYLKRYDNVTELHEGIVDYMKFYKKQRIHSSLSYKKPIEVYFDNDMMAKKKCCL